jgi:hypothetical protein
MMRIACLVVATAASLLIGFTVARAQTSPADADRIVFRHELKGDWRGVLNVFHAFQLACLRQPLTPDLPARLVPEGYQVVRRDAYWFGKDEGQFPHTAILSRTGDSDRDLAGGYPVIDLTLPNEKAPDGMCSVEWKHPWDFPDAWERMSLDLAALLPSHLSSYFRAVLVTQPEWVFRRADRYFHVATWKTSCRNDKECTFQVRATFDSKGIDLAISLREVN